MFNTIFFALLVALSSPQAHQAEQCAQTQDQTEQYLSILKRLKLHCHFIQWSNSAPGGYVLKRKFCGIVPLLLTRERLRFRIAYRQFLQQDRRFLEWLLTFKNDTTNSDLLFVNKDPMSSVIEECFHSMPNYRAAVNLMLNFLEGDYLQCYACFMRDKDCNAIQYKRIEDFLQNNSALDGQALREAWKGQI